MSRNSKIIVAVVAVLVVVGGGIAALLLLGGGDGPEKLTFDDATTTTAKGAGTPAPSSTPAAGGGDLDGTWTLSDRSAAGYRVLEDRIGGLANIEAVGRTSKVTGGFVVTGDQVSDITATVDVASITSDSSFRDNAFRDRIMDAQQFPTATFTAQPVTVTQLPADGATVEVPVQGTLTLKGEARPVTTTLQVKRVGEELQVLGSIPVKFSDFGIDTPQPPGLSVRDNGTVEFLLIATRS
ncbi:MAG: YceI family protein [Microthrixaceae bacterium]